MRAGLAAALTAGALALAVPVVASAAGPPQIPAAWVTEVTATSTTLRAEINPEGSNTHYRFEYVTEAAYQANLSAVPPREGFTGAAKAPLGTEAGIGSGTTPLAVFQHLGGLAPLTAYRYRPVAANSASATTGPEHTLTTQAPTNVFALPDERAWELVSPLDKGGGAVAAPGALFGGGAIEAATAGGALTYGSATAFGPGAQGAPPASQYVARRGASGWSSEDVSAPLASSTYRDRPDGVPYRLFAPDLGQGLLFGGDPCRGAVGCPSPAPPLAGSGAPAGYMTYYLRTSTGAFASLLTATDFSKTTVPKEDFEISFAGASPDLSHVVLSSCAALTLDAKEVTAPGGCVGQNLYEWSEGTLKAINLPPGDTETTPGALLAAPIGAISDDGKRVYVTQLEDGPIYLREGTQSREISETVGELAEFQTASSDGRFAFYTKGGHLYRWDATDEVASDLTPSGGVKGVLGASADGTCVYYQDGAGLQLWRQGLGAVQVAPGPDAVAPSDFPPATGTARVSADGSHLAFLSDAELSGHDNADAESGAPDTELYLYGPPPRGGPPRLFCASCNPTGERPIGSTSIPGAEHNGTATLYKPRALSADGQRLFFDSADKLAIADTDSRPDVYEWEAQGEGDCARAPGCLSLLSGGRGEGGTFLDASADGADAYFLTGDSLVASDPGSIDAYDARIGGGLPEAQKPIPCVGDACQALPNAPEDPTLGTTVPNTGNPPLQIEKEKPHKHRQRHHRRHRRRSRG